MKKIAIIVQRFGRNVNGGAEVHARMIAEQLSKKYDIKILTSQSEDYKTWKPVLPTGETTESGIKILRFKNYERASEQEIKIARRRASGRLFVQKIYKYLGTPLWFGRLFPNANLSEKDFEKWLQLQGPYMPDLMQYLHDMQHEYDYYIFFTALYYPSAMGVFVAPHKSILIPTMHDEKPVYMPGYKKVMASPKWIFFNTNVEKRFSEVLFPIEKNIKKTVGVGIELLKNNPVDKIELKKLNISKPYIIYIGRVDSNKGCDILIKYFIRFTKEVKSTLNLVMVGKNNLKTKKHANITFTGFVNDETKNALLLDAEALVIPSFFESLSLVLLESMGAGKPVIANAKTDVLREHIDNSNGGWKYYNYDDFKKAIISLINNPNEAAVKGQNGYNYVSKNYSWENVLQIFDEVIAN